MKNHLLIYLFACLIFQFSTTGLYAAGGPIKIVNIGGSTESISRNKNSNVLSASYSKRDVSSCSCGKDGAISIAALGGIAPYTYEWTGTNGYTAGNTASVYNLPVGYYNVKIKDADQNELNVTGMQIAYAFTVYITSTGSVSGTCSNSGTIILYGNAGVLPYTYSLDGANYQCSNVFTGLPTGSYTAYVRDLAGCVKTKTVVVGLAAPLSITAASVPSSVCTADGTIELFPAGGVAPFLYSIDNINYYPDNKFLNLSAATYQCYVKDAKGCTAMRSVNVTSRSALIVNIRSTSTSSCTNDGTIQVDPNGGVAPYTYSLNGLLFQSGNSFTGLSAGNYIVTVQDYKGCRTTTNAVINVSPVVVTAYASNASACNAGNGKIQLFRTGGFGPYTYSLNGDLYQNSNVFNNLFPGRYTAFVKDSRACIGILSNIIVGPVNCISQFKAVANSSKMIDNGPSGDKFNTIKVEVYPNPSASEFTLSLKGFKATVKASISILDLQGREVYQAEETPKGQYVFGKGFAPGIYFIHIVQDNMKWDMKIVKQ